MMDAEAPFSWTRRIAGGVILLAGAVLLGAATALGSIGAPVERTGTEALGASIMGTSIYIALVVALAYLDPRGRLGSYATLALGAAMLIAAVLLRAEAIFLASLVGVVGVSAWLGWNVRKEAVASKP